MINEDIIPGPIPEEISFGGYKTKNLHHSEDAIRAFLSTIDKVKSGKIRDNGAVLAALKATDQYMKINDMHLQQQQPPDDKDLESWRSAHKAARDNLHKVGDFMHHMDYWHMHEHEIQDMENKYIPSTVGAEMADSYQPQGDQLDEELTDKTIKQSDKIKVARVIADMLGVEKAESMSPETAINLGLRQIKNKKMTPELVGVLRKMLKLASDVGVKYSKDMVPKAVTQEQADSQVVDKDSDYNFAKGVLSLKDYLKLRKVQQTGDSQPQTKPGHSLGMDDDVLRRMKIKYKVDEAKKPESDDHDISDDELDNLADKVNHEDHILDVYDDEELTLVDKETGEEVKTKKVNEGQLAEVLSRAERLRARARFLRTEPKRMRRMQIVLHRHSDAKTINKRARRLAINMLKRRFTKKDPAQLTVSEKERVERIIEQRKSLVNKLAMRLVPRIRKIENERLSHSAVTKSN